MSSVPQAIFSSPYFNFWIDAMAKMIGVLSFGYNYEHTFTFDFLLIPLRTNAFCVCKTDLDNAGTQIRITRNTEIILDNIKKFKFNIPRNVFHNFTLGGFIQNPLSTFNNLPFQGTFFAISASSSVINYSIVFSFSALSINIIDPDWYKWNNGSDVLHKGKYVSLTEKESIQNTFGLPSEEKLSMGPLKYIDACRSCRHLHGYIIYFEKSEFEYIWSGMDKTNSCRTINNLGSKMAMNQNWRWDVGEPNGGSIQNCIIYHPQTKTFKDDYCNLKYPYHCFVEIHHIYSLRGLPLNLTPEIDHQYISTLVDDRLIFYGFENNIIHENNESKWVISLMHDPKKVVAYNNSTNLLPFGINFWFFVSDGNVTPDGKNLILTKCLENEFSCNDGFCIPMNLVCNNSPDCSDALDEEDCSIVDTLGYRKEFPPILTSKSEKSLVNITFHLKSINSIKEMKSMYDISFIIELQWKDPRLSFNNLNSNDQFPLTEIERGKIWFPPITFDNSAGNDDVRFTMDRDVQISATKFFGTIGTLNSVSELKKKLKYSGENVILKLKVSKMMSMLCVFDFHQYPFDNQKCKVEIGLTLEVQEQVALNILRDMSTSFDHIDLLQYNMKNLTFELVESKGIVVIELQRMFNNILWTTYFPTFFLQIVAILTLFFPSNRFDTTVMITITTTFVNYTLYQSVSISLPSTAYNKMIDYWLFSSLIMPLFIFVFEVYVELGAPALLKSTSNFFGRGFIELLFKYGKIIIIAFTVTFDISYWIYNFLLYYYYI
ncbi:uncharacterized protein [Lepeophtheirus salmonis]